MIFPIDVHKRALNSRKLAASDRNTVIMQVFVVANIACFFILKYVFTTLLGMGTIWAVIAQIVLFISIGIALFRFVIFNEDEKLQEMRNADSDSFAKYIQVRKEGGNEIEVNNQKVNIFEYVNGQVFFTMLFRYGSNDDAKANNTKKIFQKIFSAIGNYNFVFRTAIGTENFANSLEFKRHIQKRNKIQDKNLALYLKRATNEALKMTEEECNTEVVYLTVQSTILYQKDEIEALLMVILRIIEDNLNAFREVKLLNLEDLLEFYRWFYRIEAIDAAMMKALDLSNELEETYSNIVSVYRYHSKDGSTFKSQALDSEFQLKERSIDND